ncbi:hypothetical protein DM02DRAFT_673366 [Periconia macrospinosa]|uniref:Uncharacterized protein n=1 Tax=Periconia macrospinosa TaxID=97972 RepID=A0A2V1DKA7_9PLEO|nr:hypothetical protein DM02DRAFT_673366 [Periconia macrospinosa]
MSTSRRRHQATAPKRNIAEADIDPIIGPSDPARRGWIESFSSTISHLIIRELNLRRWQVRACALIKLAIIVSIVWLILKLSVFLLGTFNRDYRHAVEEWMIRLWKGFRPGLVKVLQGIDRKTEPSTYMAEERSG